MDEPVRQATQGREEAVASLADRLPEPLRPLARIAYNYRWSWLPGGHDLFARLDPDRWQRIDRNPVRALIEATPASLAEAAADDAYVAEVERIATALAEDLARPATEIERVGPDAPIAYLCAEFGIHPSLPIYSGGLGVLAGDICKEASDLALPFVGVGLFYRRGYFHQRVNLAGWQQEYWTEVDPDLLPAAPVLTADGTPLEVSVPVWDRSVTLRVWRVDVGRVALFLLDSDVAGNDPADRWITARLYDANRDVRLAQYTVLGLGAIRALRAIGIEPGLVHLNEGHGALSVLELATAGADGDHGAGTDLASAVAASRDRVVFTTHTPVAAGNETYEPWRVVTVLEQLPRRFGTDQKALLSLGRVDPDEHESEAGMTPLALRAARHVNAVSRRHGEVARGMWAPLFGTPPEDTPIGHVTNGVHLPTWMAPSVRALLDRHLGEDWTRRADDRATWEPVLDIPDAELWEARRAARRRLIDYVKNRIATDRLARGEDIAYAQRAVRALDPDALTLGFARRVASYKRLYLLRHDVERALALLDGPSPVQLMFAGKAHPADDGAKGILQSMFDLRGASHVADRIVFLEDYGMTSGSMLTGGCDVWLNVPRPPLEASGTSGMKSALSGGLNLSVADGWWDEAYDGTNGWTISGEPDHDHAAQDARHANELYELLERRVLPLWNQRDADGVPVGWCRMVKASLVTVGPTFSATRMMRDYVAQVYTG
ncbi:MAG: alpha-glucan family phosphorylase [Actinobacteria bacterium]|nr:alpha-glucan family phosphorylase [Actinomycetota bacterium]